MESEWRGEGRGAREEATEKKREPDEEGGKMDRRWKLCHNQVQPAKIQSEIFKIHSVK